MTTHLVDMNCALCSRVLLNNDILTETNKKLADSIESLTERIEELNAENNRKEKAFRALRDNGVAGLGQGRIQILIANLR